MTVLKSGQEADSPGVLLGYMTGDDLLFEDQLMQLADAIIDGGYYTDYACSFFSESNSPALPLKSSLLTMSSAVASGSYSVGDL